MNCILFDRAFSKVEQRRRSYSIVIKNKMKKLGLLVILSFLAIAYSIDIQAANDDFCERFPLNSTCQEASTDSEIDTDNSSPDNSEAKIIDLLTADGVETYLRELGYVDITRSQTQTNSLNFLMQGRPVSVYIAPNGKGMSLFSYYPQEEKITLEVINDWNKSLRYSFAYLYTTKDNKELVILETNLTVTGGVTENRLKSFFVLHSDYQGFFSQYLSEL